MEYPILDWQLSLRLAGNNPSYAKEFLQLLAKDLSHQLIIINNHYEHNRIDHIKNDLHKLLGALSYSGAVRLKKVTEMFHRSIKDNTDISALFLQFNIEAELFIKHINNM